jgi:DNA-binding IclR family transcriptional regulator
VHPGRAEGDTTSVLGRISSILRSFDTDRRTLSVSDLVERTGIPRATVHRQANALVDEGWLVRNGTRFELGIGLFELGQRVPRQRDLREIAMPFMADLREATGHTVTLAVLDGRDVVYVELLRARNAPASLRKAEIGGRLPAHATGVGKALLAFSADDVADEYLRVPLERLSARTIGDAGVLRTALGEIRRDGIAYDHEESAVGLMCAAAPVFAGRARKVTAAVSIAGEDQKISLEHMTSAVRMTALAISRALGAGAQVEADEGST